MVKYGKEIVLSIAQYKTVRIMITEADSFEDVDKQLLAEINKFPKLKALNKEEIENTLRQ